MVAIYEHLSLSLISNKCLRPYTQQRLGPLFLEFPPQPSSSISSSSCSSNSNSNSINLLLASPTTIISTRQVGAIQELNRWRKVLLIDFLLLMRTLNYMGILWILMVVRKVYYYKPPYYELVWIRVRWSVRWKCFSSINGTNMKSVLTDT